MSWTCECTESTNFKVKNTKEVKEVLTDVGFDVYEDKEGLSFFGEEGTYMDEECEIVLSLKPIEIEGELKSYIGLDNPQAYDIDSEHNPEELMEELGLEEKDVMRVPIYEYLQDQLEEGSYIVLTNSGYEERTSGKCCPFGSVEIITKNATDSYSLCSLADKLINKYVK